MISPPLRAIWYRLLAVQEDPGWRWRFVATHRVMMAICGLTDEIYNPTTAIESLSGGDSEVIAWSLDTWKVATGEPILPTSTPR